MRFEGTLVRWDDVRGIGYLESSQGGEPLFVHISALPVAGGRPRQGDRYSFEIEPNPRGGKQAVRGQRIGAARHPALQPVDPARSPLGATGAQRAGLGLGAPPIAPARRAHDRRSGAAATPDSHRARPTGRAPSRGPSVLRLAVGLAICALLAVAGTQAWRSRHAAPVDTLPPTAAGPAVPAGLATTPVDFSTPQVAYRCDGRLQCSQMRSCNEARYFLAHCPGVQMDGDGDGVPCEAQLCGR